MFSFCSRVIFVVIWLGTGSLDAGTDPRAQAVK
jgi:hypothetical protein